MCHAIKIIESERLLSRFGHMRNKIEAINLSSILTLTFYKTSLYSSHVPKVKFIIENIITAFNQTCNYRRISNLSVSKNPAPKTKPDLTLAMVSLGRILRHSEP